ncbi:hypothetical protein B4N89_04730 [Embleya scabrispora]|uniref:SMI1/KNR4 family protein n=1 Tax=Embleya scabrispora TaxID=159449 RepID=A0A1T3NTY4_9ACTN|nr:hypothetical protein [Embleya scabrispora]OPC80343.1 hypothetical protein B4N89_04730 [Embleya scabrispora]
MTSTPSPDRPTERDFRLLLERTGADLLPGLTGAEFETVEQDFGFRFSADHRAMLSAALPTGKGWPNWRAGGARDLKARLGLPTEGVLFDVEHNAFWPDVWGARPAQLKHALKSARYHLARVPRMVPVYGHRYLPGTEGQWGHPVLSMMQTDIVVYGANLTNYLTAEFLDGSIEYTVPTVPFWRDLVS